MQAFHALESLFLGLSPGGQSHFHFFAASHRVMESDNFADVPTVWIYSSASTQPNPLVPLQL